MNRDTAGNMYMYDICIYLYRYTIMVYRQQICVFAFVSELEKEKSFAFGFLHFVDI